MVYRKCKPRQSKDRTAVVLWVGSADVGTNMPKFVKINNMSQTHLQKHENPRLRMRGSRKEGRTRRLLNPHLHPNISRVDGSITKKFKMTQIIHEPHDIPYWWCRLPLSSKSYANPFMDTPRVKRFSIGCERVIGWSHLSCLKGAAI